MSAWQLCVKNTDGKSHVITLQQQASEITVPQFKAMVEKKIGIPCDSQRLIYAGKQFEDEHFLSHYPRLGHMSTVFLVLRLNGGSTLLQSSNKGQVPLGLPTTEECCTICFSPDDQAFLMPCKKIRHPCCSGCLMEYTWAEVSGNRKTMVCCPLCSSEWDLNVIKEYGQASDQEVLMLSEGLSMNVILSDPNISECPQCHSFCERKDKNKSRVVCFICKKNGNPDFCWHCKNPWTNNNSDNECKNPGCNAAGILAQIQNAPVKEVVGVSCPSIRLCPHCGVPIEHKEACKQMKCKSCSGEFCFICLRKRINGSWSCGSYNTKCSPAPTQDRVPGK